MRTLSWLSAEGTDEEQTDGIGANETIEFLDKFAKKSRKLFLAFGLYRPHTPYVAPKNIMICMIQMIWKYLRFQISI